MDRAQVITVDTKINTLRFSKWLTSSFRAVGPRSGAVIRTPKDLVFPHHVWDLKLRRVSPPCFPEQFPGPHGSWHSPASHPNSTEPSSQVEPSLLPPGLPQWASGPTDPCWYGLEQFMVLHRYCSEIGTTITAVLQSSKRGAACSSSGGQVGAQSNAQPHCKGWAVPTMPNGQAAAWRMGQGALARLEL